MSQQAPLPPGQGPFRADQLRDGDPYELSNGHAIRCLPTAGRGADAVATGAAVLESDPAVEEVGVDAGYSPSPDTLRAPDISVGNVPSEPGWIQGAPPLAVEYADTGQNQADLKVKIRELLAAGTRFIWVVRLTGPRRVEVHENGKAMRLARPGEQLEAPGILKNPVPVEALYDRRVGREVALRNLLQRQGYESLDAIRAEGEAKGEARGEARGKEVGEVEALRGAILELFAVRHLAASDEVRSKVASCNDPALLKRWLRRAAIAAVSVDLLADDPE